MGPSGRGAGEGVPLPEAPLHPSLPSPSRASCREPAPPPRPQPLRASNPTPGAPPPAPSCPLLPLPTPGSQWPMAVAGASAGSRGVPRRRRGRARAGAPGGKGLPPATQQPGPPAPVSSRTLRPLPPTPTPLAPLAPLGLSVQSCSAPGPAHTHPRSASRPGRRHARPGHRAPGSQRRVCILGAKPPPTPKPKSQDTWVLGPCLGLLPAEGFGAVRVSLSLRFLVCS